MLKYSDIIKNSANVAQPGATARVVDSNGKVIPIFADPAGLTPIASNTAISSSTGQVEFYLTPSAGLSVEYKTSGGAVITTITDAFPEAETINPKTYGAKGDGAAIDTQPMKDAIAHMLRSGHPIFVPKGTYVIDASLQVRVSDYFTYFGAFGAGPRISGAGQGVTIFDHRAPNAALFDIDSAADHATLFRGVLGLTLQGFTVTRLTSVANTTAIMLRTCTQPVVQDIHITAMSANGIEIPCLFGDTDGSSMVSLNRIRIDNCAGWGIKVDCAPGNNETSYVRLQHVFVQGCGTPTSGLPASGGMISKGQILTLDQCAFTLNENCAFYIPGQAGGAQTVDIQNSTFENNRARGAYVTGVSVFKARNIQFYNSDTFKSTVACEFDGASFGVRKVDIDGVSVRATAGNNPYTAFKISGVNADLQSCRVRNVVWENFDYAGQTRFDGWYFDAIPQECVLETNSPDRLVFHRSALLGRGSTTPLRLRGGIGGTPSTSGEWIAFHVPESNVNGLFRDNVTQTLIANTTYNAYLWDNNGSVQIELSTTEAVIDNPSGYLVKSGDATRLFIGRARTGSGTSPVQFISTPTGWLNPTRVPGKQTGSFSRIWTDATDKLRIKYNADPTSDTDGAVVGTQL